jgi:putative PIN family toxin of toxin-antitoxin system
MKVVLDTNVLVAAFIAHGACAELFEYCAQHHELYLSAPIIQELNEVLVKTFHRSSDEAVAVIDLLKSKGVLVEPVHLPSAVCRDADDDMIIGTAVAGECPYIVTGDKDLLGLGRYSRIVIVSPSDFWRIS